MSTPPNILSQILSVLLMSSPDRVGDLIDFRAGGNQNELIDRITLEAAKEMAANGEIEGVGSRSGRLRYVRKLPEAIKITAARRSAEIHLSRSTVFAQLNMGAYRQSLGTAITNGAGVVVDEGEICGYVYAHCACRALDGALGGSRKLAWEERV